MRRRSKNKLVSQAFGFVVAMRGRLQLYGAEPSREWLIVARWGRSGEFLSISRTGVPAHGAAAPIGLKPRSTVLAKLIQLPNHRARHSFLLSPCLPFGMALAGTFLSSEGLIHLHGNATRLFAEGRCAAGRAAPGWRLAATRAVWSAEFFEPARATDARTPHAGITQ